MPILSLASSLVTSKNRIPTILIDEDFASGTAGFSVVDATVANSSGTLQVTASDTSGHAYKAFLASPRTTFTYSIELFAMQVGSGGGHIKVGLGAGQSQFLDVDASSLDTYTGTFTTGDATAIVLGLHTDISGKWTKWDNIIIQENN